MSATQFIISLYVHFVGFMLYNIRLNVMCVCVCVRSANKPFLRSAGVMLDQNFIMAVFSSIWTTYFLWARDEGSGVYVKSQF